LLFLQSYPISCPVRFDNRFAVKFNDNGALFPGLKSNCYAKLLFLCTVMTPERQAKITKVLNHRQPDLAVVMENVHDPHNISAVMRTCDAVGIQNIYILNTQIPRHKKFGKTSSASALGWLTIHEHSNTEQCMREVKSRYDKVYATHLGVESHSLYDLNLTEKVALVFGNEHAGVTEECLKYCDGNFIIPQVGMVQSLNISVACAITLYEALRQRQIAGFYNQNRMPEGEWKELAEGWGIVE
jgi:tRNA (guanosine-2'-O-)-methyltransferase